MDTLQIANGDLVITKGAYARISGPPRVSQDLMIASLTPLGSNRFHVNYGSVFGNYIGLPTTISVEALARSEFNRIIGNYMRVQLAQLKRFNQLNQVSPFLQSELITGVESIDVSQDGTKIVVSARVATASGSHINITNQQTGV